MTTDIGTKTLDGKEQPLPKGLWGNHILTHRQGSGQLRIHTQRPEVEPGTKASSSQKPQIYEAGSLASTSRRQELCRLGSHFLNMTLNSSNKRKENKQTKEQPRIGLGQN